MNEHYIPVEGNEGLVRDSRSGAILSINNKERQAAITRKQRIAQTENRLNKLEQDISDVKDLFGKILEKLS